jgi:hypothetical protein
VPKLPVISAKVAKQNFDRHAFVELLRTKFSQVMSYGFTYHYYVPTNRNYFVETWKEMGDQHSYELDLPGRRQHEIYAFDGTQTKMQHNGGNGIMVHKGEFPERQPLFDYQSPLDIYAFLNSDPFFISHARFLSMKRLAPDAAIWKDLADHIDYAGTVRFLGRDCFVLRFHRAWAQSQDKEAVYDVSFDPVTSTPLRWQSYDLQGYRIEELALVDTQPFAENPENGPLPFTPHYTRLQYQHPGILTSNGKVIQYYKDGACDESFDEVALNTLKPEDLQIDESQIKVMVDVDTHKRTVLQKK